MTTSCPSTPCKSMSDATQPPAAYPIPDLNAYLPASMPAGNPVDPHLPLRTSYHDRIQGHARAIEQERRAIYQSGTVRTFTASEWQYLHGALYKMERVVNCSAPFDKTLDDIVDAYNYLALLYNALAVRASQGGSA